MVTLESPLFNPLDGGQQVRCPVAKCDQESIASAQLFVQPGIAGISHSGVITFQLGERELVPVDELPYRVSMCVIGRRIERSKHFGHAAVVRDSHGVIFSNLQRPGVDGVNPVR